MASIPGAPSLSRKSHSFGPQVLISKTYTTDRFGLAIKSISSCFCF